MATDPLAALAQQHGATPASSTPAAGADPLAALAASHGAVTERPADFHVDVNASDSPGWGSLAYEAGAGVVQSLNPIPLLKAVFGAAMDPMGLDPESSKPLHDMLTGIVGSHKQQFLKGKESYDAGRYSEALGHTVAALVPLIGPAAANAAELIGSGDARKIARGTGEAVGLLTPFLLSKAKGAGAAKPAGPPPAAAPASAAAARTAELTAFGESRGVPIDAATATGSSIVRTAQEAADRALIPQLSGQSARYAEAQQGALTAVGRDLSTQLHPTPQTPLSAGESVVKTLEDYVGMAHETANEAYGRLRAAENAPTASVTVAKGLPKDALRTAREQLGRDITPVEVGELRRIQQELDAWRFTKHTVNEAPLHRGGDMSVTPGQGGSPVYHDILQHAPGTSDISRGVVQGQIENFLQTGKVTNAVRGAIEVARKRAAGETAGISAPFLPPSAGEVGALETLRAPVDLLTAKQMLRPIYDQLLRESQLSPLMGGKAKALNALDRLMNGPDTAPLSVADGALSELKTLSRLDPGQLPQLRTRGQGVAAQAVKYLDEAVRAAAEKLSPEAARALDQGRAATRGKYMIAEVLDDLANEPRKVFDQLTQRGDAGIDRLKAVAEILPEGEVRKIGRAWLDDALERATAEGRFDHAQRARARFRDMGAETKTILFGAELAGDLDKFFSLAARMAETSNPSRSALAGLQVAEVVGDVGGILLGHPTAMVWSAAAPMLSKLLHSPKGVKLLTRAMTTPASATAAAQAARVALIDYGKTVGVPLAQIGGAARVATEQPTK